MPMDWVFAFLGGLMIGCAAAGYLLFNGRIMGISGIYGGLIDRSGWGDWAERISFVAGLVVVPFVLNRVVPGRETHVTDNWTLLIIGGLLVGLGTRLAGGCTSGHGVCGISRLSPRGIVATVLYIAAGMVTMTLLRHVFKVL